MTGDSRFVCTDPDIGDLTFADVDAVLDALEAALVHAGTPLFDAARQSWQAAGLHPEIRAAWEARLRYRPPSSAGLALPALPSITALVRSLPARVDAGVGSDVDEAGQRRAAFARMRAGLPAAEGNAGAGAGRNDSGSPRFAALGVVWALALLALVGWVVVAFATHLAEAAAAAVGVPARK